jgi:hypothetical protein
MSPKALIAITGQDAAQWVSAALLPGHIHVPVQAVGLPSPGPALLELESGVYFEGGRCGLLLLRAERGLAADMAEMALRRPSARLLARQAFADLNERLARVLLDAGLFGSPPQASPKPSQDLRVWDWPLTRPSLECLLMVGEHPLELRLWVERWDDQDRLLASS